MCFSQKFNQEATGSLFLDRNISFENTINLNSEFEDQSLPSRKSPLLAALFSFLIPGAGEFYSESYIKSAVFFAAEIAAITVGLIYDKKGDDQTVVFEEYANKFWNVEKYAQWTVENAQRINPDVDVTGYHVFTVENTVNWNELNRLESAIGSWYSHRLEVFGEQQYYEMIGKYPQFNPGWEDFNDNETDPWNYGDPLTERFEYYSRLRGKANDFYNVASTAVTIVVVNHIISALDAAWSASRYNKTLDVKMDLQKFQNGATTEFYPRLNIKYNF